MVEKIPNITRATFALATGHLVEPPFCSADLDKLREEWFELLGGAGCLREITPHLPFYLYALEETLRRMGDEDVDILTKNPGDNYTLFSKWLARLTCLRNLVKVRFKHSKVRL